MKQTIFLLFILLILASCTRTSPDPAFPPEPVIRALSISHDTLVQFVDQLVINIEYEDGNADLGNADADVNSIFVKDSRLAEAEEYYLAPLAPDNANVSITGTFDLKLSATFLLGNGTEENVTYDIYIVDRAGNQSNTISTGELLVTE